MILEELGCDELMMGIFWSVQLNRISCSLKSDEKKVINVTGDFKANTVQTRPLDILVCVSSLRIGCDLVY